MGAKGGCYDWGAMGAGRGCYGCCVVGATGRRTPIQSARAADAPGWVQDDVWPVHLHQLPQRVTTRVAPLHSDIRKSRPQEGSYSC